MSKLSKKKNKKVIVDQVLNSLKKEQQETPVPEEPIAVLPSVVSSFVQTASVVPVVEVIPVDPTPEPAIVYEAPQPPVKEELCYVSVRGNRSIPIKYNGRSIVIPANGRLKLRRDLIKSAPLGVLIENCITS